MITDYLLFSLKSLRKKKLRSLLTMAGIFIAIATIFVLIGLSLGLENAVQEQFRMLGTDKFFIMPKGQAGAPGSGGAVELTTRDVSAIKNIQGIKSVSYLTAGNIKLVYNGKTRYGITVGVPMDEANVFMSIFESSSITIEDGKLLEKGDKGVIMIGSDYKYGDLFGKQISVGTKLNINGKDFKVKGILSSMGNPSDDRNIYLSLEDFKEMFDSGDRVDQIIVQVDLGENLKNVAEKVKVKLTRFRGLTEKTRDFEVMTPEELISSVQSILNIVTAFLVGIAAISLIVGGIGIMNTMYTSVLERTKEIGTMKAIGARNSDILTLFVIESGLLGLVGGIIGIVLGYGAGKAVEYIAFIYLNTNLLQVSFPWYVTFGTMLFSFLIGAVSGMLPAYRASRLKPVDALRYE